MSATGAPSPEALDEIVRRIVAIAQPDKIILFGSAARGAMDRDSDLDLLIVKRGPVHRRNLAGDIYMNIGDVPYPIDVIVVTPEDVDRYKDSHALVIAPALREGRVIYDSGAL